MTLQFTQNGWDQYLYWQSTDKAVARKINELIKECLRHPFEGKGLPEMLKHDFNGFWSRRIDKEHRLVYKVTETYIEIHQCRYHYQK